MKAKDLRKGNVVVYKNAPHKVMEFEHRTPGNLKAFVQLTLRNLLNGSQTVDKFSSGEDLPDADVYTAPATFLYADGDSYHFMNSETFEETTVSAQLIGDGKYFLQESMPIEIVTFNSEPIGVNLPRTVVLTVTETDPELKGATVTNTQKPAKTDTGLSITVPPFIKIGEKVIIDTETGAYVNRAVNE